MELRDFFIYILPILSLEFLAAIAGTYYLAKVAHPVKNSKFLVYFLWFTICVELVGSYAPMAYFSDYQYFSFVKGTVFENNMWWYNIFAVLNFSFFTYYFVSLIRNDLLKRIRNILIIIFILISAVSYSFSDRLFTESSNLVVITGTVLVLLSVLTFYFELLRSDLLLQLKRFLPFYISVGVLVFNLSVAPMDILSNYFAGGKENELFIKLHVSLIMYANIFLYASFILGFLICSRVKKSFY